MAVHYSGVQWNRQKHVYDLVLWGGIFFINAVFITLQLLFFPEITAETLILRTTSITAIMLLHFILYIGPLCRIDRRFLPLLYNRRHAGVSMFFFALIHGVLAIINFHALGDTHPIASLFLANQNYTQWHHFPFEVLGFYALLIFMFMALTSHDFWLKNLGPKNWKRLHQLVYIAYVLVIAHVALGIFQEQMHSIYSFLLISSIGGFMILHVLAAIKNHMKIDYKKTTSDSKFIKVCHVNEIPENRAKAVKIDGELIAVYKYDNKVSAVHGRCRHQGGPLAEGKIIAGCITCPWHGYQYYPNNGQSPPPFAEKIKTYQVKIIDNAIWVNPISPGVGAFIEPAVFQK